MKIQYKFASETIAIEVSDEWGEILIDLDRQEYNNDHKETRRHYHMEGCVYEGEDFAPFVGNLDLNALIREFVLDFHLLGSFHGSQAEILYGKNRPRNRKSRMTAKLSFRGHPAIW